MSHNGAHWGVILQKPLFVAAASLVAVSTIAAGVTLAANSGSAGGGTAQAAAKPSPSPSASPNNNGNGVGNGNGNDKKDLVVTGSVTGLYPGASKTMTLNVANDNNFEVRLYQLDAAVGRPVTTGTTTLKANCPGIAVTITLPALPLPVPAGGRTLTATAAMLSTATNDCRNATFPISYTGKVDKP